MLVRPDLMTRGIAFRGGDQVEEPSEQGGTVSTAQTDVPPQGKFVCE
ncbi:hypothetical protein GCM10027590_57700 [Nocardiopsis nanhaiensis]